MNLEEGVYEEKENQLLWHGLSRLVLQVPKMWIIMCVCLFLIVCWDSVLDFFRRLSVLGVVMSIPAPRTASVK